MPPIRSAALRRLGPRVLALAAAWAAPFAHAAPPTPPPAVLVEAKQLLAELVAIDTTPAGSTAPAVESIAARLRAAGFGDEDLWIVGPHAVRLNLVVRLRGAERTRSALRPILLLAHLDVVAAPREEWTVEPFRLTEKDGFLYGRGTLDVKGEVTNLVVSFMRLRRAGFVPERDLILALTADEEEGSENGVQWLLAHRRELIDAAYAINTDAAGPQQQNGLLLRIGIQTSEKRYLSFELATTAPGGHSAYPTRENAIQHLAAALTRLEGLAFPLALNDTTRAYFAELAAHEKGALAAAARGVLEQPPHPDAVREMASRPFYDALLRTTCTPTLLSAGHAENALPARATATLQCRLLPGADPAQVRAAIEERIADDRVTVTPKGEAFPAPESPLLPELFRAVESVAQSCWPGVPMTPVMDAWASDSIFLRRAGIPTYGISGISFDVDDVRSHGADERIAADAFAQGVEFMHRLMQRLGGAPE
jgi:acetylornithine deacetylase/succinyl-diaminopimelate desuccinylase-like protein